MLACTLAATTASAYCRTTTCPPEDDACRRNADGCVRDGAPATWRDGPIPFRFAEDVPDGVKGSFMRALARWSGAQCPATADARAGRTGLRFVELPPASDEDAAFVVAIGEGGAEHGELGLTTLDFGTESGVVKSAWMKIDPSALSGDVDLDIVMTHEVGHYIGLAHSSVPDSIMEPLYGSIERRKLGVDDLRAVCTLYPPQELRQLPPSCDAGHAGRAPTDGGGTASLLVLLGTVLSSRLACGSRRPSSRCSSSSRAGRTRT